MNMTLKNNLIKKIGKDIKNNSNAESAQISYFIKKDTNILFKRIIKQLIKNYLIYFQLMLIKQ